MRFFKLFFLLLFLYSTTLCSAILVDDKTKQFSLLSKSEMFIDHTNSLDINSIKTKNFELVKKDRLMFGYSPDFTVWIKFTLKNSTNKKIQKILQYNNPLTTHIEFFDGKVSKKDGLLQFNFQKDSINPNFDLTLKPFETKVYYLKASSKITTLIIDLQLWEKNEFIKDSFFHIIILSMFFAAMGILAIYNFFIYFFTKDKNYLFYVLYMVGIINHQLAYTGYGNLYIFSQEMIKLSVAYAEFYVAFTVYMFAFLLKTFLNIKQYKKISRFFDICLILFPFLVTLSWYLELYTIRNLFSFILLLISSAILTFTIFKRNRQAYFVGAGWLIFAITVGLMYLKSVGVFEISISFKYIVEMGLLFEAVIFSIALADKINYLEYQKNKATMELVLKEQSQKLILQKEIENKTKKLKISLDEKSLLLKELNHRIKNNMQLIISLIRLQSDKIHDKQTKTLLKNIKGRINAMGTFHEMLYKQDNISHINANEYFKTLIEELKNSLLKTNITIKYDINTYLNSEDAIYCGIILNELITNSFKHAFNEDNGNIHIILNKKFDHYTLTVMDDGKGYDSNKVSKGLGSILIDSLVKRQLKGTIKQSTKNGTRTTIVWEKH